MADGAAPSPIVGAGPLSRASAVVYWTLALEALFLLAASPGLVLLFLLVPDPSNIPLVALALVPVGPAFAATVFAWRASARERDLAPWRHFRRGYRLGLGDVLRIWIPGLAVLAVLGINLTHLEATGLPPAGGVVLAVLAAGIALWLVHAVVLAALMSFRTRDVARLALYYLGAKPLVTLQYASFAILAGGVVVLTSDWVLAALASVLAALVLRAARPVLAHAEATFTAS
ncbi:conserved hypothetical protein [Beutenbergia cavernae DSM 12333]|uniref:Uncharacterized protein n=1 Tax=Beutenbergia cavernae (strain ATCC BAA-8 / DSM 12333 / CCUG 43141 / JCM 11478 / NBRC 16432 / NCIMB 13614 / HKI 0122) TaxID=471853 RepID=C5C1F4_BEUC1|nr:DUF624 domain-containing protein [Beutenbergia cavernae]ACQ81564.1 conserved hypothetical protein [Beutenbergia cavernae DSM 12333]